MDTTTATAAATTETKAAKKAAAAAKRKAAAAAKKAAATETTAAAKQKPNSLFIALPMLTDSGTPSDVTESIDTENFSKSIGAIMNRTAKKVQFILNGCTVTIPAETAKNKGVLRFLSTAESFRKAIYNSLEPLQVPQKESYKSLIRSFSNVGIVFPDLTNLAVKKGLQIRTSQVSSKLTLKETVVKEMKQNKVYIAETTTAKELNKMVKEKGIEATRLHIESKKLNFQLIGQQ